MIEFISFSCKFNCKHDIFIMNFSNEFMWIIKHYCLSLVHKVSSCKISGPNYKMFKNESQNKIGTKIYQLLNIFNNFSIGRMGVGKTNVFSSIISCWISNLPTTKKMKTLETDYIHLTKLMNTLQTSAVKCRQKQAQCTPSFFPKVVSEYSVCVGRETWAN